MGATALGYTGYLHALEYARDPHAGPPGGRKGPGGAAGADRRARRRAADAAGREVLRRGRAGAGPVLRAAGRRGADRRDAERPRPGAPAAGAAHPDRQGLAVAVGPGRQRPRDPGARRLRLHPRLPGRAVLPRQPAQPDPRGHPRHPGAGPARPQGRHAGRRAGWRCSARRSPPRRRGPPAPSGPASPPTLDAAVARLGAVTATLWGAGDPDGHAGQRARLPGGRRAPRGRAGCGWSRRWRRPTPTATSTRASGRRPGTSGGGSCRACTTASTCSESLDRTVLDTPPSWL